MSDESYWYEEGWPTLRQQVLNLAMTHSVELLDAIDAGASEDTIRDLIDRFVARVRQSIDARINARKIGLWNFALQVWPDASILQAALLNDLPVLRGMKSEILPEQALRENLKHRLEDTWRALNPHRLSVWRRIDKISRQILAQSGDPHGNRCRSGHFQAVLRFLQEHHPGDHNLPRTYATVETYFLQFCSDCHDTAVDPDRLTHTEMEDFLDDIDLDLFPSLAQCLKHLQSKDTDLYAVVAALYRLDSVPYTSQAAFREAKQISRRVLEKRHREAIERLRTCIEQDIQQQLLRGESQWT